MDRWGTDKYTFSKNTTGRSQLGKGTIVVDGAILTFEKYERACETGFFIPDNTFGSVCHCVRNKDKLRGIWGTFAKNIFTGEPLNERGHLWVKIGRTTK